MTDTGAEDCLQQDDRLIFHQHLRLIFHQHLLHMRNLHKLNWRTSSFAMFTSTKIANAYTEYKDTAMPIWCWQFLVVFVYILCLEVFGRTL